MIPCGNSTAWSATLIWSNTATSSDWNTASNWGGTVPGSADIGLFSAASYTSQPSLTTTANIGGIWDTGSGAVTISGASALTLFGTTIESNTGIEVDAGAGPLTVNVPLVLQNYQQWMNNSASGLMVNGAISGAGGLTLLGSGTLTLGGSNTYTGNTAINGGVVSAAIAENPGIYGPFGAKAASAAGTILFGGGTLQYSAANQFDYSGRFGTSGNQPISIDTNGQTVTFATAIQGAGTSLTKLGSGILTITGMNTYGGSTTVDGGTLQIPSGSLYSPTQYVGYSGTGSFTQSGGTNFASVSGSLLLGYNVGSYGTYNLSGSGLLTAQNEQIGQSGTGSFTQSSGTNSLSRGQLGLALGYNVGSYGTFNLSGSGLLVASNELIGYSGTGSFTQSGGTNHHSGLTLGDSASSTGTYSLSGSGLLTGSNEYVGNYGTGSFTQSGGTHSLSTLGLGRNAGSNGTYCLTGSGLLTATNELIGQSGTGSFTQSGGTNSVSGSLLGLSLGDGAGGSGTYNLNGGWLSTSGNLFVGNSGSANFTQSGGVNTISGAGVLYLGNASGATGTYNLSGSGLLTAPSERIGYYGTGSFTQSGGTNSVSGGLVLAQFPGSSGTYNLNGGVLSLGGLDQGTGGAAFNFGGGTLAATAPWSSSLNINMSGIGGLGTIDTTGGNISLSGNLAGQGGLIVAGVLV